MVDEDKENGGAAEDPADGTRGVVRKYWRPVKGLTRGDPRAGSGSAIGVPGTPCSTALTWTPRSPATLASWALTAPAPAWARMLVKKPSSLSSEFSLPHGGGHEDSASTTSAPRSKPPRVTGCVSTSVCSVVNMVCPGSSATHSITDEGGGRVVPEEGGVPKRATRPFTPLPEEREGNV